MTALAFGLSIVAMAHGINYYDTAWGYHAGQAEPVMEPLRGGNLVSLANGTY